MGVRERLASLGTDLGRFNQGEFSNNFLEIEGVDVTRGYCAGVCLDWTRRVLLSRPDRDPRFLNYSSPKNASVSATPGETRQTATLRRMAAAYRGQGASYVTTTRKNDLLARLTALLGVPEATFNFRGARVTGVPVPNETAERITHYFTFDPSPFDMRMEPAGVVPRQRIQGWLTSLADRADPQLRPLADGGREWGHYANELDSRFTQTKRKKFGSLRVVKSSNQQTYLSPNVWRGEFLAEGLMDNCCTILGVSAPGDTGHAVAIHQRGDDYRFFDPNYGVFRYPLQSLTRALQHLFGSPYFSDDPGLDPDLPVYRRRTNETEPRDDKPWTRMSYTIFAANS